MSATYPFRGKWTCYDIPDNLTLRIDGNPQSGTKLLLYKVGEYYGYDFVYAALQSDNVTPTKPAALHESYLSPVPYSGGYYKANGVGSTAANAQQKAAKFMFKEGVNAYFVAFDGPPGSLFDLWAAPNPPGGKYWGWTLANPLPAKYAWQMNSAAPSAAHARTYLGGVCPAGADYTWVDLTDEDYSALSMVGATFAGADLTRTDLRDGDLSGADFRGVHSVNGTKLTGTKLVGAHFSGVDLAGMDFTGCDLTGADFSGAKSAVGANFADASLNSANLVGVDLAGAKFTGTDLRGARLAAANLTDAVFLDSADRAAQLTGVDFSVAASVRGARFGTGLVSASFTGQNLTGVDFTGAVMKGTNFSRCDLRPAVFSPVPTFSDDANNRTNLSQAVVNFAQIGKTWSFMNLVQTQILDCPEDLTGLDAQSSLMMGWVLSNHNLAQAILSNTDLSGATLTYCNLTNARMDGVQLQKYEPVGRSADLSGSQMENAVLTGANLTGTALTGVYLWGSSATIAKATLQDTDFSHAYLTGLSIAAVNQGLCLGVSFDYACLINADLTYTVMTAAADGKAVGMNKTCLQGANLTGANLSGANLAAAAVDENPGKFPVTIQNGWPAGNTQQLTLSYQGTIGIEKATDHATTCPAGSLGPCVGSANSSPDAPTSWPVTSLAKHPAPILDVCHTDGGTRWGSS